MTGEGYNVLDEELRLLKTQDRPSVIAAIGEARAHGDLSENAEYHAAKERQGWIEGRIAEIEDKMARAQVIDVSKLSGKQVKFGATVTVVDEDTEDEARYQIVGEHEADIKRGRLALTSPLARGMIGKESGDVVEVSTPNGIKAYEILKVECGSNHRSAADLGRFRRPSRHRQSSSRPSRIHRPSNGCGDRHKADRVEGAPRSTAAAAEPWAFLGSLVRV